MASRAGPACNILSRSSFNMEVLLGAVRTQIDTVRRVLPLTYCGSRSLATSIAEGYDMSMLAPPPLSAIYRQPAMRTVVPLLPI